VGKEITTIAITGVNADRFLIRNGVDPRRFVVGVFEDTDRIDTAFGKLGISFGIANQGVNREITLDCSAASGLQGKRYQGADRKISVGSKGMGEQQIRKGVEIVVVTTAKLPRFEINAR
jgi:hypothetical protein